MLRRPFSSVFSCLCMAGVLLATPRLSAMDPVDGATLSPSTVAPTGATPLAGRVIKLGTGSVDAVSGNLNVRMPLGPTLPGRIPLGFTWTYDAGNEANESGANGGELRPVVWPSVYSNDSFLQQTVKLGGASVVFYRGIDPLKLPSKASLLQAMTDRHVLPTPPAATPDGTPSLQILEVLATTDESQFLIIFEYQVQTASGSTYGGSYGSCILNGSDAIWFQAGGSSVPSNHVISHFTNRWGDHVQVDETYTYPVGGFAALNSIEIKDMVAQNNSINLTLETNSNIKTDVQTNATLTDGVQVIKKYPWTLSADTSFNVTNTLGLPTVHLVGKLFSTQRFAPYRAPWSPTYNAFSVPPPPRPEGLWDTGFQFNSVVTTATNGESKTLSIIWGLSTANLAMPSVPLEIDYPNGLVEKFTYENLISTSSLSFSRWDGRWIGFRSSMIDRSAGLTPGVEFLASGHLGITQVQRLDSLGSSGQCVKVLRVRPKWEILSSPETSPVVYGNTEPRNLTAILEYPTADPTSSSPFRALRLTHPTYDSSLERQIDSKQGFLFATSAVLFSESLTGAGLPTSPTGLGSQINQVAVFDGFSLSSWANPTGSLTSGLPVTAVARRTKVYTSNLPTRITVAGNPQVAGAQDAFGPVMTDEYTDAPQAFPTVDGTVVPLWSSALPADETLKATKRHGQIQRDYDSLLMRLLVKTDQKTLNLDTSQSHTLRFLAPSSASSAQAPTSRITSADFGKTTYTYDSLGRISQQDGDRGGFKATDRRTYQADFPLIVSTTKDPLTGSGGPYYPNPYMPAVEAKKTFTWLDTHVQAGPSTVVDSMDGRTERYTYDSQLGREVTHIDVLGITTNTDYDDWGRKATVTRLAKGAVKELKSTTTYDVNGRFKDESITAEGQTLRTRTEIDAFGRTTTVTTFDAAGAQLTQQSFVYDGFGQKIGQSPVLARNQQSWGYEVWTYDDQGRVMDHYDRCTTPGVGNGRWLSTVLLQPTWTTISGITGIWTTTKSPDPNLPNPVKSSASVTRSECVDLLGQKRAVIDQAAQLSQYFYDQDGHLLQTLQGSGASAQQRTYTYNALGWMTSRTEPEEGKTVYSNFNMFGTPLTTEQWGRNGTAARNAFTTTLDQYLRPITVTATGPEGKIVSTDPNGVVTRTFSYFPDNTHLLQKITETTTMSSQAENSLSETYTYDDLFRLNSKTVSDGTQSFTVSRTLDAAGRVTTLTYPAGGGKAASTVTTTYDAALRPSTVVMDGALRGMMSYDQVNTTALTNILTLGNGATTLMMVDAGDLVLTQHAVPNGGMIESNALSWSAAGLMMSRGNDTFTYDSLQRLSTSHVVGVFQEQVDQWFKYDTFGRRFQHNFKYTAGGAGSVQPAELRAWKATYPTTYATNDLPAALTALSAGSATGTVIGTYNTGVGYDALGRQTSIFTTPGNTATQTTWIYDPSGRVVMENGTSYLLDSEGLRFKRMRADGSTDYTVYGFNREPLAQFSMAAPAALAAPTTLVASSRTKTTVNSLLVVQDLAGAYITQPSGAITVAPGTAVSFVGDTDFGTTLTWSFGDGGSATGTTASHAFTSVGTYTVTFRASATGYQTSTDTVAITVIAKPSITSFTASPASIVAGQSSTLAWTTTGATALSLNQAIGTVTGTTSKVVAPTLSTTYTLTATNAAGSVTATLTVAVSAPARPTINSFTATPAIIAIGKSTTLAWNVSNAVSLSISGIGTVTGSSKVVSPKTTSTYILTALNAAGTTTTSITVTVQTSLPRITDFYADPYTIAPGGSTTLKWIVSLADSLSIDQGIGTVAATGSRAVTPSVKTTYKLSAKNLVGTSTATVTLMVTAPDALRWTKSIVYGFGQELAEDAPGVGTTFIQSDFVGSPSVMTDPTGTVVGRSKNLPFGERMACWGTSTVRRYTNHEDDPDSGAIYMQAREYLPTYGKFAQVDPAYDQTKDDPETWNLYNYVTNNPVTKTDPDGRFQVNVDGLMVTNNSQNLDQMGYGIGYKGTDLTPITFIGLPGGGALAFSGVAGVAPSAQTGDPSKVRVLTKHSTAEEISAVLSVAYSSGLDVYAYINGVGNNRSDNYETSLAIQAQTGGFVIGVYNPTTFAGSGSLVKGVSTALDLVESGALKAAGNAGHPVGGLLKGVLDGMQSRGGGTLLAHSEGAIFASNVGAMNKTADGYNRINLQTFGGAAWTIGGTWRSQSHQMFVTDFVPMLTGRGWAFASPSSHYHWSWAVGASHTMDHYIPFIQ